VESGEDSRRVAVMLGRPIKVDLKNQQYDREINSGERAAMLSLNKRTWWLSMDYANITWRSPFLGSTPENIQEWYKKGPITADMVKEIFEHQYRPYDEPREKRGRMPNQKVFTVLNEETQRSENEHSRKADRWLRNARNPNGQRERNSVTRHLERAGGKVAPNKKAHQVAKIARKTTLRRIDKEGATQGPKGHEGGQRGLWETRHRAYASRGKLRTVRPRRAKR
jgi:hypothetical protein